MRTSLSAFEGFDAPFAPSQQKSNNKNTINNNNTSSSLNRNNNTRSKVVSLQHYEHNKNVDFNLPRLVAMLRNSTRERIYDEPKSCECVHCVTDPFCGRLWKGYQAYGEIEGSRRNVKEIPIHLVVSYCKGDLSFIVPMIEGYNIASIHVISKCGNGVKFLPSTATIETLQNVGRCDHSYAHYINDVLDQKLEQTGTQGQEDAIVSFVKDNAGARNLHQLGRWNSFENMVNVANSKAGFCCGMIPEKLYRHNPKYLLSGHFETKTLRRFTIKEYRSISEYAGDDVKFRSKFPNFGDFYDHLGAPPLNRTMVHMCFGGVFTTTVRQIKIQKAEIWEALEKHLRRGDSIQEGHYAERIWGMLLATPLENYQVAAIKKYSDYILSPEHYKKAGGSGSLVGAIVRKVKRKQIERGEVCNSVRHCWRKTRKRMLDAAKKAGI